MKALIASTAIALASMAPAFAATIFPGPGAVSITDADVAIGFSADFVSLLANDTPTWTFTNNSSTDVLISDFIGSGLSNSSTALASVLLGFDVATTSFDAPFLVNGSNVSGDATLSDLILAQGDSIDLIFDASSAFPDASFLNLDYTFNLSAVAVPVPAGLPLALTGIAALAVVRRKKA